MYSTNSKLNTERKNPNPLYIEINDLFQDQFNQNIESVFLNPPLRHPNDVDGTNLINRKPDNQEDE